jgi:hypothetical protein
MAETALVKVDARCVRCGAPVPSPSTVCFECGGSPLYASDADEGWSIVLEPVPGQRLRGEVARTAAAVLPGVRADELEARLGEGQPPLWLVGGLSEASATALADRFSRMKAPAQALRGEPAATSGARGPFNLVSIGLAVLGLALLVFAATRILGALLLVAAAAAGYFMARRPAQQLGPAATAGELGGGDPELDRAVRALVEARERAQGATRAAISGVIDRSRALLGRLGDEEDAAGFVAGGTSGALGHEVRALLTASARGAERGDVAALAEAARAMEIVDNDLSDIARAPDAADDVGQRLQAAVARVGQAARSLETQ